MKTRIINEAVWTQTSGLSSPGQLMSGSDLSYVLLPNVDTVPTEELFISEIQEPTEVQAPSFPGEAGQGAVSPEEMLLQASLVNLLQFAPSPDEPTEEDIGNRLKYKFPD